MTQGVWIKQWVRTATSSYAPPALNVGFTCCGNWCTIEIKAAMFFVPFTRSSFSVRFKPYSCNFIFCTPCKRKIPVIVKNQQSTRDMDKLSRQETPNSVKIKTKCNVCVTTLCEHSICDHSMLTLYMSTLCETTLCVHSMWEHSICELSMCDHSM